MKRASVGASQQNANQKKKDSGYLTSSDTSSEKKTNNLVTKDGSTKLNPVENVVMKLYNSGVPNYQQQILSKQAKLGTGRSSSGGFKLFADAIKKEQTQAKLNQSTKKPVATANQKAQSNGKSPTSEKRSTNKRVKKSAQKDDKKEADASSRKSEKNEIEVPVVPTSDVLGRFSADEVQRLKDSTRILDSETWEYLFCQLSIHGVGNWSKVLDQCPRLQPMKQKIGKNAEVIRDKLHVTSLAFFGNQPLDLKAFLQYVTGYLRRKYSRPDICVLKVHSTRGVGGSLDSKQLADHLKQFYHLTPEARAAAQKFIKQYEQARKNDQITCEQANKKPQQIETGAPKQKPRITTLKKPTQKEQHNPKTKQLDSKQQQQLKITASSEYFHQLFDLSHSRKRAPWMFNEEYAAAAKKLRPDDKHQETFRVFDYDEKVTFHTPQFRERPFKLTITQKELDEFKNNDQIYDATVYSPRRPQNDQQEVEVADQIQQHQN